MPDPIRLLVRFTPFPPGFVGDLSKYNRAFIDRIEVLSPFAGLSWQIGGLKPTSNVGPWLNDLGQPFVWDDSLKDYVPMDVSLSVADLQAQADALTAALPNYSTTAAMNAAITAAIAAAVAGLPPAAPAVQLMTIKPNSDTVLFSAGDADIILEDFTVNGLPVGNVNISVPVPFVHTTPGSAFGSLFLEWFTGGVWQTLREGILSTVGGALEEDSTTLASTVNSFVGGALRLRVRATITAGAGAVTFGRGGGGDRTYQIAAGGVST